MGEVRRATLRDVASSLGVSVNTVSRALAGKDSVSERTRARVSAEAERLGYVPNSMARSLVLGSATTLGMVITNPSNPFYAQLISSVEQRCRVHGYSLLLMVTEESFSNERRAAEEMLRRGVDGVLVVSVQEGSEHLRRLTASHVPIVLVNRDIPELNCDLVGVDHVRGGYEAARHVVERGVRRILVMEEDLPVSPIADRVAGFRKAMADRGIRVPAGDVVAVPTRRSESSALPWDPGEAYRLTRDILAVIERPAAFVVGNDFFALGVYRAVTEAGLRIPDDVVVVGYGGHPFAPYLNPPLTTVELPAAQIGVSAVDHMLRRLSRSGEGGDEPEKILFAPTLVVRASSGGADR